jgi:hypothetical protein
MRYLIHILGGVSLAVCGCASNDKPAVTTRPVNGATVALTNDAPKVVPMPGGRGDDYTVMGQTLTFTPEQKAKFDAAVKARNEAYDKWAKSERGQRYQQLKTQETAARRANDAAKLGQVTPELTALRAEQENVRAGLRREFDKSLTLDQQRQWASHALLLRATKALERTALTEAQKKEAKTITDRIAAERVNAGTAQRDPYLLLDEAAVREASEGIRKLTRRV